MAYIAEWPKRPISLIVNTHTSDKPGEHWIALILDQNGSGQYFDSYGLPPLNGDINSFMGKMCPLGWAYNPVTLQCLSCITCGHYCVLYIKLRNFGYSYCDFISLFSKNLDQNEKIVKKLVPISIWNKSYSKIKIWFHLLNFE